MPRREGTTEAFVGRKEAEDWEAVEVGSARAGV